MVQPWTNNSCRSYAIAHAYLNIAFNSPSKWALLINNKQIRRGFFSVATVESFATHVTKTYFKFSSKMLNSVNWTAYNPKLFVPNKILDDTNTE